jgi:putative transposase
MNTIQPLEYDSYYHIYNRGINGENLFYDEDNFEHFLRKYDEYIDPIAETYAWCLLKNHFHFSVRFFSEDEIGFIKPKEKDNRVFKKKKKYNPSRQFANLFDAYAKAFNTRYKRTGGLFETPFRRIKIDNDNYLKNLIYYIHNNPVKHGFVDKIIDYPWSSYNTLISEKPTKIKRETVLGWFSSKSEFVEFHNRKYINMDTSAFDLDD